MNLRWYQTYDKNGVNSEIVLQICDDHSGYWEDIPFVREREDCQEEDKDEKNT